MSRLPSPESIELTRETFVSLGAPGLFAVAFLEFFLFPVPPDMVLIPLAAATPEFALLYALVATAGSVLAGLAGYTIGRRGGRPLLESRFSEQHIARAEGYVGRYGYLTVFVGAFAPIPEGFELLSIASGVLELDVRVYLVAAVAGRGGRYFLEALLVLALGDAVRNLGEVDVYAIMAVATLVLLLGYAVRRRVIRGRHPTD